MHPLEEQQRLKGSAQEAAELAAEREQEKVRQREEIEVLRAAAETHHTRVEVSNIAPCVDNRIVTATGQMADAKVLEMESQQSSYKQKIASLQRTIQDLEREAEVSD